MWLARDKNNDLYLYGCYKPNRLSVEFECGDDDFDEDTLNVNNELFSEVTWDNSPVEVELKIKDK